MNTLALMAVAGVVLMAFAIARPKSVFYAAVFLLPWNGLNTNFVLGLTPSRVLFATLLLVTLPGLALRRYRAQFPLTPMLKCFLIYVILISAVRIPFLPSAHVIGGALRAPDSHAFLQLIYFSVMLIGPLILCPVWLHTERDFLKIAKVFLASLLLLSAIGCAQLGMWYATGRNPLPVGLVPSLLGSYTTENASFSIAGSAFNRMNSLANEPKDLGQSLAGGLLLVQVALAGGLAKRSEARLRITWVFLFLCMLLTYSTSSIFYWVIGSSVQGVLYSLRPRVFGSLAHWLRSGHIIALLALAVASTLLYYSNLNPTTVRTVAEGRTVQRFELEEFDEATLAFLRHEPGWAVFGTGLGNTHLYANPYLTPEAAAYSANTAFRPKTGILQSISEIGIVGLILWTLALLTQLYRLSDAINLARTDRTLTILARFMIPFVSAIAISYLAIQSAEQLLAVALGVSIALTAALDRRRTTLAIYPPPTLTVSGFARRPVTPMGVAAGK